MEGPKLARRESRKRPDTRGPRTTGLSGASLALLGAAFLGIGLLVYEPALDGPFLSDDQHYVQNNVFIHELSAENLVTILNPRSVLPLLVENWAPVHLLLHAFEWQVFGEDVYGYHVVNVILHAVASLLLVLLLQGSGLPALASILGGGVFLVHTANVEAVAWISQLKSSAGMALALGALLAHPRRPLLGAVLFAMALLAKPIAAFALAVLILFGWAHSGGGARESGEPEPEPTPLLRFPSWRWGWVGAWAGVLAIYAVLELSAFSSTAGQATHLYAEPAERLRSSFAVLARYLVMSVSSYGVSAFHQPPPARSWLDPWWIAGLAAVALLGWRALWALRTRRVEAAWWAWAPVAFIPVSGLAPLNFPMADRYLYFILPGLIGGALLAGHTAAGGFADAARRHGYEPAKVRRSVGMAACAAGAALAVLLAVRSHERARLWLSPSRIYADSARNYPDGQAAHLSRARAALVAGDRAAAITSLENAHRAGYVRLEQLHADPTYASLQGEPRFRALLEKIAGQMLEQLGQSASPSQFELHAMALAHEVRSDTPAALRALEQALEVGGPIDERIRADLDGLRAKLRRQRGTGSFQPRSP